MSARRWERLMRTYEIERADDRNDRGVFGALVASLVAVFAVAAVPLQNGAHLRHWAYLGVPLLPLAIIAMIANIVQAGVVRRVYMDDLLAKLDGDSLDRFPLSPVSAYRQSWDNRWTWLTVLGIGMAIAAGVCALAALKARTVPLQASGATVFGIIWSVELVSLLRTLFFQDRIVRGVRARAHARVDE
jgi:hypothetical protein